MPVRALSVCGERCQLAACKHEDMSIVSFIPPSAEPEPRNVGQWAQSQRGSVPVPFPPSNSRGRKGTLAVPSEFERRACRVSGGIAKTDSFAHPQAPQAHIGQFGFDVGKLRRASQAALRNDHPSCALPPALASARVRRCARAAAETLGVHPPDENAPAPPLCARSRGTTSWPGAGEAQADVRVCARVRAPSR